MVQLGIKQENRYKMDVLIVSLLMNAERNYMNYMNRKLDMKKEYSDEVDKMRKNRVEVSFYKYGPAAINFGEKLVNAKNSAAICVKKYEETKNKEYLLDAMNYLMFEFMYPSMDGVYFKATDSSESAGKDGVAINE